VLQAARDLTSRIDAVDPEVAAAIQAEFERQQYTLELIPSENIASPAVLQALGSLLNNKYAEGYPGKRYYGGCENVDVIETLAIERAKALFGAEHANVQPHSGTTANYAVYASVLKPGDTVLGMDLSMGGHLSHGSPVNFSGKLYHVVPYGVDRETERIDYDALERQANEVRPKMLLAGYSAYPRILDFERMAAIARSIEAVFFVDMAHFAGLVAGGAHPSPVPHADLVSFTTHKTMRGPWGAMILCKAKYAADVDKSVFPGIQGGPLNHAIAGKAVMLQQWKTPEFKTYAPAGGGERQDASGRPVPPRPAVGQRWNRQSPDDGRPAAAQSDWKKGPGQVRYGRHHRQPKLDPLRHCQQVQPQWHPAGQSLGHHPRHGPGRNDADCRYGGRATDAHR